MVTYTPARAYLIVTNCVVILTISFILEYADGIFLFAKLLFYLQIQLKTRHLLRLLLTLPTVFRSYVHVLTIQPYFHLNI